MIRRTTSRFLGNGPPLGPDRRRVRAEAPHDATDGSKLTAQQQRECVRDRLRQGEKDTSIYHSLSGGYRCFVPLISFSSAWATLLK